MTATHVNVYQALKDAGVPLDNHESDLYAKVTPVSAEILKTSGWNYSRFMSNIDGAQWFEIPFGFYPFWEKRQAQS